MSDLTELNRYNVTRRRGWNEMVSGRGEPCQLKEAEV
jgi:hypothetical protein